MGKMFNTAIVGGGASGLMTAIELLCGENALLGQDVLVLERCDRVGKKLIATGNGQGNLMNQDFGAKFYRGEKSFVQTFVDKAVSIDLEKYLYDLGIPLCTLKDGKKYPLSRQASAVLDIFRAILERKGCNTQTDAKVTDIVAKNGYYILKTSKGDFKAKSVVLAFGGKAQKQFGTDGTGYGLAESFGHKKTALYPSLVQLKTETSIIRGLKGLKEVASVTAYVNENKLCSSTGDLLFTDYGVSGSTIFQISAYLKGDKNEYLRVEFLPELDESEIEKILIDRERQGFLDKNDMLCGLLNKRIGQAVLKSAKSNSVKDVAHAIKDFRLNVVGTLGFDYAQVTKGGIATDTIDPLTMESMLQKNLYIIGEALDVDGDCGGYNITFAFISGIISARGIKAKNN